MPFFGVPIRNGLPIGLGSVAGFGVQQFDPSQLFEGGTVAGAWYDPSDLSTMFTTDAGTTPVAMPGQGAGVAVGLILDKSGNGNHARSFGAGLSSTRPELRARVNLLTYSEEFDNGAWAKTASTISANATIAPDGTLTADKLIPDLGSVSPRINISANQTVISGASYVATWHVNAGQYRYVSLFELSSGTGAGLVLFDLQSVNVSGAANGASVSQGSITNLGNGWFRLTYTYIATATTAQPRLYISGSGTSLTNVTGDGTSGIYIWGADLRPANIGANVPAYQRIADANTYDTNGFPLYLRFDGIDDSMYTPANLNLSGTDKVAVFAGVRKNTDPTDAMLTEFSAVFTNAGSFAVAAPWTSTTLRSYFVAVRGSAINSRGYTGYPAPISNVLTASITTSAADSDAAQDVRINAVDVAGSSIQSAASTGNFGTYPLYIGARNNSSLWFNGHLYSLIIAGSAVSAGNISVTEQWVAGKTGIQI